jgi:transcriptional regulator with XRE-family HTH domain
MKTPTIAQTIRAARVAAGLTQEEAAQRAGYSRSMWGRYEAGLRTPPPRSIPGIMAALGVKADGGK